MSQKSVFLFNKLPLTAVSSDCGLKK